MRLLIFTQKVDRDDPVLGFFHTWIKKLASKAESVSVICLEKGGFDLPPNVTVYSLGKENGVGKLGYVWNLYKYLFLIRGSYDKVFVHMNQEYVLLAGLYWKLARIPVYLWRNHPHGSLLTIVASLFSTRLFYTSPQSFTARFKKARRMPAGIDTSVFCSQEGAIRKKYSVCMVGRISPIKHVDLALWAINMFVVRGGQISFSIAGPVLDKDQEYYEKIREYVVEHNLSSCVHFTPALSQDKLPKIYSSHEVCLNLTSVGSFDKTIVEAAACGAIPLVSNESLIGLLPPECITENSPEAVMASLKKVLDPHLQVELSNKLADFVKSQSLDSLLEKLVAELEQYV